MLHFIPRPLVDGTGTAHICKYLRPNDRIFFFYFYTFNIPPTEYIAINCTVASVLRYVQYRLASTHQYLEVLLAVRVKTSCTTQTFFYFLFFWDVILTWTSRSRPNLWNSTANQFLSPLSGDVYTSNTNIYTSNIYIFRSDLSRGQGTY